MKALGGKIITFSRFEGVRLMEQFNRCRMVFKDDDGNHWIRSVNGYQLVRRNYGSFYADCKDKITERIDVRNPRPRKKA